MAPTRDLPGNEMCLLEVLAAANRRTARRFDDDGGVCTRLLEAVGDFVL